MADQKPSKKRFFDDWLLTIGGASGGGAFLRVKMPHNPKHPETYITGSTREIKRLANVMDQLLCQLTGTKTGVKLDGTDSTGPDRRLG